VTCSFHRADSRKGGQLGPLRAAPGDCVMFASLPSSASR